MKKLHSALTDLLFSKHILVCEQDPSEYENTWVETIYALMNKFAIRIVANPEMATPEMLGIAEHNLGVHIPDPFYVGFPESVRRLTPEQLLFDQLYSYYRTYGSGNFDKPVHSLLEDAVSRSPYKDSPDDIKDFTILSIADAYLKLSEIGNDILATSRPLSKEQIEIIKLLMDIGFSPIHIGSKQNACALLYETKRMYFNQFIELGDIPKLVDYVNWTQYGNEHTNKLNLKNQDRKFLTKVLDGLFDRNIVYHFDPSYVFGGQTDFWKGFLHHIHYKAKNGEAKTIIKDIREDKIKSYYSGFEDFMHEGLPISAARYLTTAYGNGALLRNLNYILMNCHTRDEFDRVFQMIEAKNPVILIQMLQMYYNYNPGDRTFVFTRHGHVVSHREEGRLRHLDPETVNLAVENIKETLRESLRGKIKKTVYIDPIMTRMAVPMNMSAGSLGYGMLPTGSTMVIPDSKKVRLFTYWEKVNDIDLGCFLVYPNGSRKEFSWRSMYRNQSDAVTYSGDCTSGFNGGSEYFDIDIDAFKEKYPDGKYIVFTNNVYSGKPFCDCVCRAGFMSRDGLYDKGHIYEPKSVKTSWTINANSTFCYLFALNLQTREIVWLNMADSKNLRVAGETDFSFIDRYLGMTYVFNMYKLFQWAAQDVTAYPEKADLVVGETEFTPVNDKPYERIHSWEFEKAFKLLG